MSWGLWAKLRVLGAPGECRVWGCSWGSDESSQQGDRSWGQAGQWSELRERCTLD